MQSPETPSAPTQAPASSPAVDRTARYRRNPRLAEQTLAGKAVVLHYEGKRILGLNETGTQVWALLDGRRTVTDISVEVAARAGESAEAVEGEVLKFVAELVRRDLVIVEEGA